MILTSLRIGKALTVKNLKLRTNSKLIVGQIINEYEEREEKNEEIPKDRKSTRLNSSHVD